MVVKALAIFIWTFVLHFSLKQGCYRAGKPGKPEKIRELKICSKSQGKDRIYQENGQVREMSGNFKAWTCQTCHCIFIHG